MKKTISTLDVLEKDKIDLNTLCNFVDWFAPNRETNDKLQGIIITIGCELEEYRELKG